MCAGLAISRHHWQELTALKLDALLNAFTKHFVIFALKFRFVIAKP